MIRSASSWLAARVNSVLGSASVVWAPAGFVVVVLTTVVAPMAMTLTDGSSSRMAPWSFGSGLVVKIATEAPGDTKPATRPVSDRVTEIAMSPSGIVSVLCSPDAPNLAVMICSLG